MKKRLLRKKPANSSKTMSNICKQTFLNNPLPSNEASILLESIKYIQEGNFGCLFLTIKYLASETMLTRSRHNLASP